jgi:hypothetical protein
MQPAMPGGAAPTGTATAAQGGSMPAMTAPTATPMQVTNENRTMMLTLLERIEKVAGDQMKEESKSGKLTVDRAELDEILANIAQIKTMLQK